MGDAPPGTRAHKGGAVKHRRGQRRDDRFEARKDLFEVRWCVRGGGGGGVPATVVNSGSCTVRLAKRQDRHKDARAREAKHREGEVPNSAASRRSWPSSKRHRLRRCGLPKCVRGGGAEPPGDRKKHDAQVGERERHRHAPAWAEPVRQLSVEHLPRRAARWLPGTERAAGGSAPRARGAQWQSVEGCIYPGSTITPSAPNSETEVTLTMAETCESQQLSQRCSSVRALQMAACSAGQ